MLRIAALAASATIFAVDAAVIDVDWTVTGTTWAGPSTINAVAGDSLSFQWNDPTTLITGGMFHDVVVLAGDACTFETGYTMLPQSDIMNGTTKLKTYSGLLLTEGTHYISCSVGSVAWCDSNTSVVQMATGGGGCSPEIGCATGSACSWNHCEGSLDGGTTSMNQKVTVVVAASAGPAKTSGAVTAAPLIAAAAAAFAASQL